MDVGPDGWMLLPGTGPTQKGGAGLGWSVASQRKVAEWGQDNTPGIPLHWAEVWQGSERSEHLAA